MNILVIAHYHYQGISVPTALFVHEQMREYLRAGHCVRIIVPTPIGKKGQDGRRFFPLVYTEVVDGIEHVFLRYPSFSKYGEKGLNSKSAKTFLQRKLTEVMRGFKPDIIHAHKLGTNTELGAFLKEITNCPLVITSHGETRCEDPWMHKPESIKAYADKADVVVCVSSVINRCMHLARVDTSHRVILNGFAVEGIQNRRIKNAKSIMYAGHLTMQKRVAVTITAFMALKRRYHDAFLTIMGQGTERPILEQQCVDYDLTNAVCFTGEVSNREVLAEMSRTQFFVMPSVHEGFGIVYLEAMASGCITIGTEGEGIADLIISGENGFLVPPDDPNAIAQVVEWCMEHPVEADAIAERGRQSALSLTWEANAKQYISLFEELLHDGNTDSK